MRRNTNNTVIPICAHFAKRSMQKTPLAVANDVLKILFSEALKRVFKSETYAVSEPSFAAAAGISWPKASNTFLTMPALSRPAPETITSGLS